MAFSACLESIGAASHPRLRILDPQDIVGPVAIGALSTGSITQFGELTVQAQFITFLQADVTVSTSAGQTEPEGDGPGVGQVVALMAIGAAGLAANLTTGSRCFGGPAGAVSSAVHALAQTLLDEPMTLGAR